MLQITNCLKYYFETIIVNNEKLAFTIIILITEYLNKYTETKYLVYQIPSVYTEKKERNMKPYTAGVSILNTIIWYNRLYSSKSNHI